MTRSTFGGGWASFLLLLAARGSRFDTAGVSGARVLLLESGFDALFGEAPDAGNWGAEDLGRVARKDWVGAVSRLAVVVCTARSFKGLRITLFVKFVQVMFKSVMLLLIVAPFNLFTVRFQRFVCRAS